MSHFDFGQQCMLREFRFERSERRQRIVSLLQRFLTDPQSIRRIRHKFVFGK